MDFPTPKQVMLARVNRLRQELSDFYHNHGPYNDYRVDGYLNAEIDTVVAEMNAAGWNVQRLPNYFLRVEPPDISVNDLIAGDEPDLVS